MIFQGGVTAVNKNTFALFVVGFFLCVATAHAGSESLAREYVEKSGFAADIRANLEKVNSRGQNPQLTRLLAEIDFKKIEGLYAQALAREMDNEELSALLQSLSIPGLHSALKKQGRISLTMAEPIMKEVEAAANRVGGGNKQNKPAVR